MRTIRRQSRKEASPEVVNKVKAKNGKFDESKKVLLSSDNDTVINPAKIVDYEEKIKELEKQIFESSLTYKPLNKNEEKLLSAIKSEIINQDTDEPVIGRSMLLKKYKVNSKYLDDSIKGLEARSLIKRTKVPYTSKIMTNSWKLLS